MFSFLLCRNTMNLLTENTFCYQFGNQHKVKEPNGRRKTYLCYQLKLPDGPTLNKDYTKNKVPSRLPRHRAGGLTPSTVQGEYRDLAGCELAQLPRDSAFLPSWAQQEPFPPAARSACPV